MREHRPVIALDFPSFEAVMEFTSFPRRSSYLKVGVELIMEVQKTVRYLEAHLGHSVFGSLLHIPNNKIPHEGLGLSLV